MSGVLLTLVCGMPRLHSGRHCAGNSDQDCKLCAISSPGPGHHPQKTRPAPGGGETGFRLTAGLPLVWCEALGRVLSYHVHPLEVVPHVALVHIVLHWLHTIISNAKALIGGTFHGLGSVHLQRYLDEFCYRFNRRRFGPRIFPRLVEACVRSGKITCYELTG